MHRVSANHQRRGGQDDGYDPKMLPESPTGEVGTHARRSICALASLVLGLVLCCPLTSVAAIILGAVGINATRQRTVTGRGLAVAGLSLGVLGAALQLAFGAWAYRSIYEPLLDGPAPALRAGIEQGPNAMLEQFALPEGASLDAEAAAFVEAVRTRYGNLVSSQLDRSAQAPTPDARRPEFEADFDARFERATVRTRCCIQITDPKGRLSMKLLWIEIIDPARGDLRFPPAEPKKP
jgi:hypothetical protein